MAVKAVLRRGECAGELGLEVSSVSGQQGAARACRGHSPGGAPQAFSFTRKYSSMNLSASRDTADRM